MCLAVPGRVESVRDDRGTPMGVVDFDGVDKEVCLAFLPEAAPGDYVIVHAGFAIAKLDENAAMETLAALRELGASADPS